MEILETNSNLRYEIDVDNRTVTVRVSQCISEFVKIIGKSLKSMGVDVADFVESCVNPDENNTDNPMEALDFPGGAVFDQYVGVARCHPDDVFDPEKGMDLARSRALLKREKAYYKATSALLRDVLKEADAYADVMSRRQMKEKTLNQVIERCIKIKTE